jgi:hypothetical protein
MGVRLEERAKLPRRKLGVEVRWHPEERAVVETVRGGEGDVVVG